MITFLQYYAEVSLPTSDIIENVSVTSKSFVGDNGSTLFSMVINSFSAFRYIRVCQRNSGYFPKDLLR